MMKEDLIRFSYIFKFDDGEETFTFDITEKSMALVIDPQASRPEWINLDFCQCAICPLDPKEHPHCYLALAVIDPVQRFKDQFSTTVVKVYVKTPDRIYYKNCDLQTGLGSLLGLLMATSECPHFQFLRPMARFHLPFATYEETIYRVISTYLLEKFYLSRKKFNFDFNELVEKYTRLESVNKDFATRLRHATEKDSTMNAITLLDMFAQSVPFSVEDHIEDLAYLFKDTP